MAEVPEVVPRDVDGDGVVPPPGRTAGVVRPVLQPGPADHQPADSGGPPPLQVDHQAARVGSQVQGGVSDVPAKVRSVLQFL